MNQPNENLKQLSRQRVNKHLEGILSYPLTVVTAPIGYGKTTAVRDFLRSRTLDPIWVDLAVSGGSTAFAWDRLTMQIALKYKDLGENMRKLGLPTDAPQRSKIIDLLWSETSDHPFIVVLDDCHLAKDPQAFELIRVIVKQQIDNLHIVMITRSVEGMNLSELTSLCNQVTLKNLEFQTDEVAEYFDIMGVNTDKKTIREVTRYTDGWIAMIYLILLGLKSGQPMRRVDSVTELVEHNLYANCDEETKDILQRLSVMDSFTAKQAGFVLERGDIDVMLRQMQKQNAFLVYDEIEKLYRIHNILLDFLRDRHGLSPEEQKLLFHRIAEWQLGQKEYVSAFLSYEKSGEPEKVFTVLNSLDRPELLYPHFVMLWNIFDMQPNECWIAYPLAFLHYTQTLLISGNADRVKKGLDILNTIHEHYENDKETHDNYRRIILGDIHVCRIFINIKDLDKMIYHVEQAAEYYNENMSAITSRKGLITFGLPLFIYAHYHKPGELKTVAEKFGASTNVYAIYTNGCGTGGDYLCDAEYALLTMDLQTAELCAFKALHKAGTKEQDCIAACAYFALIRINIFEGKVAEALELLEQLTEKTPPVLNTTLDLITGYVYGTLGWLDKIPEWLRIDVLPNANMQYGGMGWSCIVYGKTLLLQGDFIKADMLCESFLPRINMFNNVLGLLHNHIHRAAAKAKSEGEAAGIRELCSALSIGQSDNIILPFAESSQHILPLLTALRKTESEVDTEYLKRVISACILFQRNNPTEVKNTSLSRREVDVLRYMAEGMNKEEIAKRMCVTVSTVKRHTENAYRKLGVNNNVKAVKKATEIGLI